MIQGGMIPKVECCIDALSSGVSLSHILDGRAIHVVLLELPRSQHLRPLERAGRKDLEPMLAQLAASSRQITRIQLPELDDGYFCDLRHYNERGYVVTSAWLDQALSELRQREP